MKYIHNDFKFIHYTSLVNQRSKKLFAANLKNNEIKP
jgi:hypothetical protein